MATPYELTAIYSVIDEIGTFGSDPCTGCEALRQLLTSEDSRSPIGLDAFADLARDHMYQRHPDEYHERRAYHAARTIDDQVIDVYNAFPGGTLHAAVP